MKGFPGRPSITDRAAGVSRPGNAPAAPAEQPEVPLELGALYRAHAQAVARWAARLAGPALDVEDIVHEVFLVVRSQLPRFRPGARMTTWLYGITQNVVRHQRRKQRWRNWLSGSATDVAGDLEATGPTPLEELERQRALRNVYRILDGMSDKLRTVFILFEIERLSGEEVAELTGAKVATVWVQLHRARADFFKRMEAMGLREPWATLDSEPESSDARSIQRSGPKEGPKEGSHG
jgi:RNA polymerase sigma-70 factor (ECF subfamily)